MHLFVFTGKIRDPFTLYESISISTSGLDSRIQEVVRKAANSVSMYSGRMLIVNPSDGKSLMMDITKSLDNEGITCKVSGFNNSINQPVQMSFDEACVFITEFFTGR